MGLLVVSIWKSDGGTTVPPISHGNGLAPAAHKVATATDPERSEGAIKKRPNYLIAVKTRISPEHRQDVIHPGMCHYLSDLGKRSTSVFPSRAVYKRLRVWVEYSWQHWREILAPP